MNLQHIPAVSNAVGRTGRGRAVLASLALVLGGCAVTPATTTLAESDIDAVLRLGNAEALFERTRKEITGRQLDRSSDLRRWQAELEAFWRDHLGWQELLPKVRAEYEASVSAADLAAIRATLAGPHGTAVTSHEKNLERAIARQTMLGIQQSLPELEQHIDALERARGTGGTGTLTPEEDLAAVRAGAEAGEAAAQFLLAEKLLAGNGAPRDIGLALAWLEKSAAREHAPALDLLASLNYRGVGVARDFRRARELMERAVAHQYLPAINNLAWLLATCPDERLRDGKRAVAILEPVMDQSAQMLDTLAAAHAEAGEFDTALDLQRQALTAIGNTGDPRFADFLDRVAAYAAGKPWRDPRPVNARESHPAR